MRPQHIMFLGFLLAIGTLISLSFGGDWLGDSDQEVANSFTVFKQANILGIWSVTVPNISFLLVGLKSLIMMDFAFFTGGAAIFQWVLFLVIGSATLWGIYMVVISVAQGFFGRR